MKKMNEKKNVGELVALTKLLIMVDVGGWNFDWVEVSLTLWLRKEEAMGV